MVSNLRSYDIIGFGDEVCGALSLISAAREYRRRTKKFARILLMSKGMLAQGIGGHLVRGGLAYLDRSQVEPDIRKSLNLDPFGEPSAIYREFLQKSGVISIALDPRKADAALRKMCQEAGIDLLSNVSLNSVVKDNQKLASINTPMGAFAAKQFIDATVNAELAQAAGVAKHKGFETFGLPESELPVTLVFESQGLSVRRLKEVEFNLLKRFTNFADTEAQKSLLQAAGGDRAFAEQLQKDLIDSRGNLKTLWAGSDHIDIRSLALSISYHAFRNRKLSLGATGIMLDKANIAVLDNDRLSWNALLFAVTGTQAETLARNSAKPTPQMLEEFSYIQKWLKTLGATAVIPAIELYIRHCGNVIGVVQPLTGSDMLMGGVAPREALGTFAYHFDVRGGITGIGSKAGALGFPSVSFPAPTFNIGIQHALIKDVPNLAVVSPGSGFEGYACSAGRIVEYNSTVGQGVGIAAVIALLANRNLATVGDIEVRKVLDATGQSPRIYGFAKIADASKLERFESLIA